MQQEYDYLYKYLIIGNSSVGKSSILLRLSEKVFNENFLPTIGVDFIIRTFQLDNKNIKALIWDTAGQERFKTITGGYYKGAKGVFLVFDLTDSQSFKDIDNWLLDVNKHETEDIVKLLVGNKCDLVDKRIISKEEAQQFAEARGMQYLETSAKDNTNIDNTFMQLSRLVKQKFSANDDNEFDNGKVKKRINLGQQSKKKLLLTIIVQKLKLYFISSIYSIDIVQLQQIYYQMKTLQILIVCVFLFGFQMLNMENTNKSKQKLQILKSQFEFKNRKGGMIVKVKESDKEQIRMKQKKGDNFSNIQQQILQARINYARMESEKSDLKSKAQNEHYIQLQQVINQDKIQQQNKEEKKDQVQKDQNKNQVNKDEKKNQEKKDQEMKDENKDQEKEEENKQKVKDQENKDQEKNDEKKDQVNKDEKKDQENKKEEVKEQVKEEEKQEENEVEKKQEYNSQMNKNQNENIQLQNNNETDNLSDSRFKSVQNDQRPSKIRVFFKALSDSISIKK